MSLDSIRTLDRSFLAAGITDPIYASAYNDQWKHFRTDAVDGVYQVGGGWAYEIRRGRFISAISAAALETPNASWADLPMYFVDPE